MQEKLTPYMLAVLREQFSVADLLESAGLASRGYKNRDGETVVSIAKRLQLPLSMKYLGFDDEDIEKTIGSVMHPPPRIARSNVVPPSQAMSPVKGL